MNSFLLDLIAQFDGVEGGGQDSFSVRGEKQMTITKGSIFTVL